MPDSCRTPSPVSSGAGRRLPFVHYTVDAMAWLIALSAATFLRYDFSFEQMSASGIGTAGLVAIALQGLFGAATGLYSRRWRYGSFDELFALGVTVVLSGIVISAITLLTTYGSLPRSVPLLATGFTATGTVAARSLWRLHKQQNRSPKGGEPLVVIGAGEGSYQVVRMLLADAASPYEPVAMLDDAPGKRNLRFQGVRVEGTLDDLVEVAAKYNARHVLMAIPTASGTLIGHLDAIAKRAGLTFLVLPAVRKLFDAVALTDIRPVVPEDLLGREPVEIDSRAIADCVTGKRVLVTGAGGSIGSELCRQLHQFEPAVLVMLDRDETALHSLLLSIDGRALLDDPNLALADIRDRDRVFEIFNRYQPQVVFHTAALKHLSLVEANPEEAWKTNVLGTQNVLDAASAVGCERVVNISTDKAANPVCVLGYTKRIAERLAASHDVTNSGSYVSVRFGNVLGSRGSVLVTFRSQADAGGPITVTHPDVTRFFMTVQEAVRLTIFAGAIGRAGEALVLDMGAPVRILDVAQRFANRTDPPLEIVFTGMRSGEKLHEELLASDEDDSRPVHPLISHVRVPPLRLDESAWSARVGPITLEFLQQFSAAFADGSVR